MSRFAGQGFVCADSLSFSPYGQDLLLQGQIACAGNIVIDVLKILEYINDDPTDPDVQSTMYSYNVKVQGVAMIFRYDNMHPEVRHPGHPDEHHKHLFRPWSSEELADSPIWIGEDKWPTLAEVI